MLIERHSHHILQILDLHDTTSLPRRRTDLDKPYPIRAFARPSGTVASALHASMRGMGTGPRGHQRDWTLDHRGLSHNGTSGSRCAAT